MTESIDAQADFIMKKIETQQLEVADLKKQLEEECLVKARAVAFVLYQKPEIALDHSSLQELADKLGIEEIHISNKEGILYTGTVPAFYGMDYHDGEQMKPFTKCIEDKNFEIVQEATRRDSDGRLFQYIGVPRLDEPGIVQIGISPKRLEEKLEKSDIKYIVEGVRFNEKGKLYVVDANSKRIVSSDDQEAVGRQAEEYFANQLVDKTGDFEFNNAGDTLSAHYQTGDGYIVLGTLPSALIKKNALTNIYMLILIIVVAFTLFLLAVLVFVKKSIVQELYKVLIYMKEISKGDLTKQLKLTSSK